jgi:hypothetical protein
MSYDGHTRLKQTIFVYLGCKTLILLYNESSMEQGRKLVQLAPLGKVIQWSQSQACAGVSTLCTCHGVLGHSDSRPWQSSYYGRSGNSVSINADYDA